METHKIVAINNVISIISHKMNLERLNYDKEFLIKPELIIDILKKLHYHDITIEDIDKATQGVFHCKSWAEENGKFNGIVFQRSISDHVFKLIDTLKLNQYLSKSGVPSTQLNQDIADCENH